MDIIGGIVSALDVGIRLLFVYLILGLGAAAVQEAVASLLRLRAKNLRTALNYMLNDPKSRINLASKVAEHPLIRSYKRGGMPSYIPVTFFRVALLQALRPECTSNLLKDGAANPSPAALIKDLPEDSRIRSIFEALTIQSSTSREDFSKTIADWFFTNMDAASANYRMGVLKRLFGIAIVLTVLANVNTFRELEVLLVPTNAHAAGKSVDAQPSAAIPNQLGTNSLIGWGAGEDNALVKRLPAGTPHSVQVLISFLANYAVGWLLTSVMVTILAISLFDVLSKVMQIRPAGRPLKR